VLVDDFVDHGGGLVLFFSVGGPVRVDPTGIGAISRIGARGLNGFAAVAAAGVGSVHKSVSPNYVTDYPPHLFR
jgi:hypothetical protein